MIPGTLSIRAGDRALAKFFGVVEKVMEPTLIRRRSVAVAAAKIEQATADAKVADILARAEYRQTKLAIDRQKNLEAIIEQAAGVLPETVNDEPVDPDWTAHFWDCAQDTSNEQVSMLWSKILANEVSKPGSFSRQTVNIVKLLTTEDAQHFAKLCQFSLDEDWLQGNCLYQYEHRSSSFPQPLTFTVLNNLDSLGLIRFDYIGQIVCECTPEQARLCHYHGRGIAPRYRRVSTSADGLSRSGQMEIGRVCMTKAGRELSTLVERRYEEEVWSHLKGWFGTPIDDAATASPPPP